MNNLSLALYFADLSGNIGNALTAMAVGAGIGSVLTGGIAIANHSLTVEFKDSHNTDWLAEQKTKTGLFRGMSGKLAIVCLIAMTISVVIPTRNTILMIAASEMGETVARTPEAQEIMGEIRELIRGQIKALKKQ